jgi:hypothetical protein
MFYHSNLVTLGKPTDSEFRELDVKPVSEMHKSTFCFSELTSLTHEHRERLALLVLAQAQIKCTTLADVAYVG